MGKILNYRRCLGCAGGQWVRSKNFDTFFPISPMMPASEITDPQSLTIRTRINGELVQDGATADMIFTVGSFPPSSSIGVSLSLSFFLSLSASSLFFF
jgi:hypothetical protein